MVWLDILALFFRKILTRIEPSSPPFMKTHGEQIVITKKLGPLTYLGYAAGDAGNNLAFAMFGMFLLLHYTDVAGITAAAAGTLFLAVRACNVFADISAGRIVDRTRPAGARRH
jgi:Na+/melibiose symporter-like transporter